MRRFIGVFLGSLTAMLIGSTTIMADDQQSMKVGNTTITVGGGTAILTLPDVESFVTLQSAVTGTVRKIGRFNFSDDFDSEIGWNVNGDIEVDLSGPYSLGVGGFWSRIEDKDSFVCRPAIGTGDFCGWTSLVDPDPANITTFLIAAFPSAVTSSTKREVDHWGGSIEGKWYFDQASPDRFFTIGFDARGIDQQLTASAVQVTNPVVQPIFNYSETLDTRYYGAYVSVGSNFSIPYFSDLFGLKSSIRAKAGLYHADTDYSGTIQDLIPNPMVNDVGGSLSLSRDEIAFIGGLVFESHMQINSRTRLSLKSEYEYYSFVPSMAYNQVDQVSMFPNFGVGGNVGTSIDKDDAFSMRTSLRLTIGLGPDELFN